MSRIMCEICGQKLLGQKYLDRHCEAKHKNE